MKWIRTAVTVVIMIVSVGVIALGINNLTQEKVREEVVTFEILSETTVTGGTYDSLLNLTYIDGNTYNLDFYVNDTLIDSANLDNNTDPNGLVLFLNGIGEALTIYNDNSISVADYDFQVGNIVKLVEEVPQPPILSGTIAIILGLVPLIVASGVLYFMLRKNNLGD